MQCVASALHGIFAGIAISAFLFAVDRPAGPAVMCPGAGGAAPNEASEPVAQAVNPDNSTYVALTDHLSRRYRIAPEATALLVGAAFDAGRQVGLDPLLLLAVMAIESRFNPIAWSGAGAKGLMQIIPEYHLDRLREHGGKEVVLRPTTNILLGAQILKEYIGHAGSLEAGLQSYNGAQYDFARQYAHRILAEKERLNAAARDVERALPQGRPNSKMGSGADGTALPDQDPLTTSSSLRTDLTPSTLDAT